MPIRLKDIKDIATIVKTKYGNDLQCMNFVFCLKTGEEDYFIFQEIQGMPIKRLVYHESNNSVSFVASWASWNNPFALVADANYEQIENWKDLQDRSRPYNSYIDINGGFNKSEWKPVDKRNKTEKDKKHKHKSDVFVEFRIDRIERAKFNEWGFELYSSTISMIAFKYRSDFPYYIDENIQNVEDENIDDEWEESNHSNSASPQTALSSINKISWQGKSFNVSISSYNSSQTGAIQSSYYDLDSYWDSANNDEENALFDEEMREMLLGGRKEDDSILDVGQKKIDLFLD